MLAAIRLTEEMRHIPVLKRKRILVKGRHMPFFFFEGEHPLQFAKVLEHG
jgi:hypothetical protein